MISFLAHLFTPRHSNNHRARFLHSSSLLIIIVSLLVSQVSIGFLTQKVGQVLGYAANIAPSEVVRLTNEKRAENGLSPVVENPSLSKAAYAKGLDMLAKGYWAHVAPDGTQPWKFFIDVGYNYRYAGENLARDFTNPSSTVDAWMASPSHRENMLSPKYKEIGIGVVDGKLGPSGADTTIIVQFFGTKIADTLPVAPVAKVEQVQPTPVPVVASATPEASPVPALGNEIHVSPFNVTKGVSLGLAVVLTGVIAIDGIIIARRRLVRIGGRSLAHFAFFGMIIVIIIIAHVGQII